MLLILIMHSRNCKVSPAEQVQVFDQANKFDDITSRSHKFRDISKVFRGERELILLFVFLFPIAILTQPTAFNTNLKMV